MKSLATGELRELLREVSRSFYLTLRVLPAAIRPQMGLAYLLARASDTIADAPADGESRLETLRALGDAIRSASRGAAPGAAGRWTAAAAHPAERRLLERLPELLELLRSHPAPDRGHMGRVLQIIITGQERDLLWFGAPRAGEVAALQSAADLDDYTYRVAGCVGEFWTRLCRLHVYPEAPLDCAQLEALGVRFGKGLQLVNILRDLPKDLSQGRCYLPATQLLEHGLRPADLLDPASIDRLRPLYDRYLDLAEQHLRAGWAYTNALPANLMRLRLACAWPVLIGMRTLALLRAGNPLDGAVRSKISRGEVYGLVVRSLLSYPRSSAWNRLVP
jgi:farnesyl-diphosphate farnesyltransferase